MIIHDKSGFTIALSNSSIFDQIVKCLFSEWGKKKH
jgi:hypothetical protein